MQDEPEEMRMKHDYPKLRELIKHLVNVGGIGRIVLKETLEKEHDFPVSEHQIKVLIKAARKNTYATKQARDRQDEQLDRMLMKIGNESPTFIFGEGYHRPKAKSIPEGEPIEIQTDEQQEETEVMITGKDGNLEQKLRKLYGIKDENWVPVTIWGDVRNPMVKWERRKMTTYFQENPIELLELPEAIQLTPNTDDEDRIAVLSIRDVHFGLLTEHPEPYEKYDLKEASKAFLAAATHLMQAAIDNQVKKLVIPIGSDLLHVDGSMNMTTKGTKQDTNSFWWDAFDASINTINQTVSIAKVNFDEVILVIEPGNHDTSLARAVGIAMKSAWSNEPKVSILDNPNTMKRVSFGNTHLFMHHGNSMKPALIQSLVYTKHPEVIKAGSYVEVLCGHYHQRSGRRLREPGDYFEFGGMVMRITPALCPASNWSESQGYISAPGAQLTVYDEVGFVSLHEWTPQRM